MQSVVGTAQQVHVGTSSMCRSGLMDEIVRVCTEEMWEVEEVVTAMFEIHSGNGPAHLMWRCLLT